MASSVKGGSSIDRLSNLPDSILCHILSFLPTKYSVRTSVLSTRWRYLYTLVSNLDFEGRQSADFMNFVEKVLFFHDTTCIKRFGLILDNDLIGLGRAPLNPGSASRICGWIRYALNRPLQELYLATRLKLTSSILPSSLFTSKTLVKLELIVSLALIIPTTVCFPSLKTLHFECVNFNDHDSFDRLVSGCPMLEEFVIRSSWVKCKGFLYISHSSLKKLTIGYNFVSGPTVTLPRVAVDAPSLVYLRLSCILGAAYSLANLHSLVKVDIENVADYYCSTRLPAKDSATNLVGGISNVQSLHFTNDFFWFLSSCHKPLPVYHNLVHLAISPNLKYDGCKVDLVDLLECTPKLRTLIFNKEALQNLSWVPRPKRVPSCLLSHLKAIEIHSFVGQMETAVKYFLKNGSVLEKLIIEMGMEGENSQRLPRNY